MTGETIKITICKDRTLLSPCSLDRFNYQADTYIGCEHYCYYCYALRQAETNWVREIQIHHDLQKRLADELKNIPPQQVYFGYHADPYQPIEKEQKQTRLALETLLEHGFSAHILTKSDLFLRDLEILKKMQVASVSVSVSFLNKDNRRLFEGKTIDTKRRINALRKLKEEGVKTGAMLCPIIPHISEPIDLLADLSTCADSIWIYGLSAEKDDSGDIGWRNTKRILRSHFKDISHQAESAIASKEHPYWKNLRKDIVDFIGAEKLDVRLHI